MSQQTRIAGTEVGEERSIESANIPEWCAVFAGIGEEIDSASMRIPDHLVGKAVDISRYRSDVLLDTCTSINAILKALLNLRRIQSMVDKVLEEGRLIGFLIGLIEGEVSIILFRRLTAVNVYTYTRALCSCQSRMFRP